MVGDLNEVFAKQLSALVSDSMSHIITSFLGSISDTLVYMFLVGMSLDPGDPDRVDPFFLTSSVKVLPEISITDKLEPSVNPFVVLDKEQIVVSLINEGFAVRPNVDRTRGTESDDASGQLSSSGTAIIATDLGIQPDPIFGLLSDRYVFFSFTERSRSMSVVVGRVSG